MKKILGLCFLFFLVTISIEANETTNSVNEENPCFNLGLTEEEAASIDLNCSNELADVNNSYGINHFAPSLPRKPIPDWPPPPNWEINKLRLCLSKEWQCRERCSFNPHIKNCNDLCIAEYMMCRY
jgi:hypothetical protein